MVNKALDPYTSVWSRQYYYDTLRAIVSEAQAAVEKYDREYEKAMKAKKVK